MKLDSPVKRLLRVLVISLVCLQVLDGITTFILVRAGAGIEANGLLAGVAGTWWIIIIKVAVAITLLVFLRRIIGGERYLMAGKWLLAGMCAFYIAVVGSNLRWLALYLAVV